MSENQPQRWAECPICEFLVPVVSVLNDGTPEARLQLNVHANPNRLTYLPERCSLTPTFVPLSQERPAPADPAARF